MPQKLNISENGKAWKLELEAEAMFGKNIGEKISGKEISENLEGYELKITGGTDSSGFAHKVGVEGPERKKLLLTKGWGMHQRPRREGKKKTPNTGGLRMRKTVRGQQLSEKTAQINLTVEKVGSKKLSEIFPEQNKPKENPKTEEKPQTPDTEKPTEIPKEEKQVQEKLAEEKVKEETQKTAETKEEPKSNE